MDMRYKTILLFGAPGSGKGTQGKIVGTIPGFYHNATGDIFRSLDLQSEMGRVFWEYAGKGQLVLDGIPRNLKQAEFLEDTIDVVKVIHLVCADKTKMVERLRRRALKENRFDDASDAVIRKRLEVYERETRPLLGFYPPDRIVRVEATMSQIRVLNLMVEILVPLKEEHDRNREQNQAAREAAKQVTEQPANA